MFDERFIDREIGELCMEYDKIKGANTNIQRISPSLIDGLKPVQRRALFVMFDKDGGRTFHKLATISGDVFGKVHPHCLHGDTEFMLTNGEIVPIKELYERDQKEFKIISYDATRDAIVSSTMHDVRITKYVNSLHKIIFSNDGVIRCTNDHKLLVVRDGKAIMIEAQKLNIGDTMYPEINNITVSDIFEVSYYDKIPVYDFTADPCHNGMVFCGDKNNPDKCAGIIVSNSPVAIEDAIVNIAQSWHNNIPLIEGQGNYGCHDSKTEVLTKDGWKYFKDLTIDDELATIAPNCDSNNEITYEKPIRLFEYDHISSLVTSEDSSLTFNVTPNHRMLISDDGNEFYFAEMLSIRNLDKIYMMSIVNNKPKIVEVHPKKDFINNYYWGKIYCAEVPTYHTLITRYNGTIMVSGNSIAGDPAGASRYIKARLSDYAYACFFEDWKDSVVDTTLAYDEETKMPDYLPAKYPNVLLNGCLGIG